MQYRITFNVTKLEASDANEAVTLVSLHAVIIICCIIIVIV